MLAREEEQYLAEMDQKEETTLERQAKMRERARSLKEHRESERLQFVQEKYDQQFRFVQSMICLYGLMSVCLALLSRRLIGELIVYEGIRRPSVFHRLSTFSNDIASEAVRPILFIFHI